MRVFRVRMSKQVKKEASRKPKPMRGMIQQSDAVWGASCLLGQLKKAWGTRSFRDVVKDTRKPYKQRICIGEVCEGSYSVHKSPGESLVKSSLSRDPRKDCRVRNNGTDCRFRYDVREGSPWAS